MADKYRFGIIFCLFLMIGVFFTGCLGDSSAPEVTPITTTLPATQFTPGDIIAKTASGGETQLYVITNYDVASDEYERRWIYKNSDGSWGHYSDDDTDRAARTIVDKVYPVTVAHVTLSAIPVVTPTVVTAVPTTLSGYAPTVTAISPASGAKDATVTVSIAGTNFQTGAVPQLLQPGSPPITATGVSVAATKIDCTFNLYGKETGKYNVVVTNPDGQSGSRSSLFTIGEAAPIVSSVSPGTLEMDEQSAMTITGKNFQDVVYVRLTKGTLEIPCSSPASSSGTQITCDLDLSTNRYPQVTSGEWDVKVINIEGLQAGSWTKKFTITNSSSSS